MQETSDTNPWHRISQDESVATPATQLQVIFPFEYKFELK